MPNGARPSRGEFTARLFSGILDSWTARHQQGLSQQREDVVYQQQLADKERLAGEAHERGTERIRLQDELARGRAEAAKPPEQSFTERYQEAIMNAILSAGVTTKQAEIFKKAGLGPKGKPIKPEKPLKYLESPGAATAEARRALPNFDENTWAKLGEIMYSNKIDALTAAATFFKIRGAGEDIGGLPGAPVSQVGRQKRMSTLVKSLTDTGIDYEYKRLQGDYPSVFGKEDEGLTEVQDRFVFDVADFMISVEEDITSGKISAAEGMSSKMNAFNNAAAAGLAGTPGENYEDSPVLNNFSDEARTRVIQHGLEEPLPLDPQAINEAASAGAGLDMILFGGGESPSFEDIILRMVMQGYDEAQIMDAMKGIFDPEEIRPIGESRIGGGLRTAGREVIRALQRVR